MGPFKATSGVILPYYLNAATNFLDKKIAPHIVHIMMDYLQNAIKPTLPKDQPILLCGMEMSGGVLVSQFASNPSKIGEWADFCYIRKDRKTTGTCQQLEGPNEFTTRTSESKELLAIWIDDALSTGDSLCHGINVLKKDYNIKVVVALYLCDRSKDRLSLTTQKITKQVESECSIHAIYDLEEIDKLIPKIEEVSSH